MEVNQDTSLVFVSISPEFLHIVSFLSLLRSASVLLLFPFPSISPSLSFLVSLDFYFPASGFLLGIPIWYLTQSCNEGFSLCTPWIKAAVWMVSFPLALH